MGDRVLIQVVNGQEISPVAYGHWCGDRTPEIVARLKRRMKDRPGDVSYTFARLVQEMTNGDDGALSFGCWNADVSVGSDGRITAKDSHGDAGCVIIDVSRGFRCDCLGGYLSADKDGMPKIASEVERAAEGTP